MHTCSHHHDTLEAAIRQTQADLSSEAQAQGGGEVVVTRAGTHDGPIIAVTRQDGEGRILSVIAEAAPPSAPVEVEKALDVLEQAAKGGSIINTQLVWGGDVDKAIRTVRAALAQQSAPPSAPVGVEALRGAVARGWCADENAHKIVDPVLAEAIVREVAALAQQPAAVDDAMMDRAARELRDLHREFGDGADLPEKIAREIAEAVLVAALAAQHKEPKS